MQKFYHRFCSWVFLISKKLQKVFFYRGVKVDVERFVPLGNLLDGKVSKLLRGEFGCSGIGGVLAEK